MGIIIAALFILIIICFYFIAILNVKLNRFKNNERQQELMIEEMEASIASFLADIEDDNKKLIAELTKQQAAAQPVQAIVIEKEEQQEQEPPSSQPKTYAAPKSYVKNAYASQPIKEQREQTVEERVKELYMRGMTIEDIAKQLKKGKTEIELLMKFQKTPL